MGHRALVIFDVDGTLLRAELVTVPAVQETFAAFGLPAPDTKAIQATFGTPVAEYEAWIAGLCPPGRAAELVAATNRRELELIREVGQLYPGAIEALDGLQNAGHVLATCSNASIEYLDEVLDAHRLRRFFTVCRCIGEGYADKTGMVRDIMAEIHQRPAIVLGDRRSDITATHANGALAIAAAYGFGPPEELGEAAARVSSLAELPGIVDNLCRHSPRRPYWV